MLDKKKGEDSSTENVNIVAPKGFSSLWDSEDSLKPTPANLASQYRVLVFDRMKVVLVKYNIPKNEYCFAYSLRLCPYSVHSVLSIVVSVTPFTT